MSFAVGSLVRARLREWVVLPGSTDELLHLQPLGGQAAETAALLPALEPVEPATFAPPSPDERGDLESARLLEQAVRMGFRASAGPFRSLAGLSVSPRPYQFVPLLMALRQNPVRLLVADDVGIGKTIEASLIAKELLERGEANGLAVLCPPHLAEQWRRELLEKFGIDAALVLPSTAARLERQCPPGVSVFQQFRHTVVSLDYIKTHTRRHEFRRNCPNLIIVDEAHTCARAGRAGSQQQRHDLIWELTEDPGRHVVLTTATPHSGKEDAFRSLLTLVDREFDGLPNDLSGALNEQNRRRLAQHLVQRRRADIQAGWEEDAPFPDRKTTDRTYKLHPAYAAHFEKALRLARTLALDEVGPQREQRVRWWSALAMLRSIGSSPAAAIATLKNRAGGDSEADSEADGQELRAKVYDEGQDEEQMTADSAPRIVEPSDTIRSRYLELAKDAEALLGDKDHKLAGLKKLVKELVDSGSHPIVFCKYIATAEYYGEELAKHLRGAEVMTVTGSIAHDEREARIDDLAAHPKRVLVCTDCLSEGINLQEHFDTVIHADLAWSPTRHEQREGRVDRYGQPRKEVKAISFYGENNPVDGIVFNVLLKKHEAIRSSLGVSVPMPVNSDAVLEAVFEASFLKGDKGADSLQFVLDHMNDWAHDARVEAFETEWESARERERRSRTLFAQNTMKPEEVQPFIEEVQSSLGHEGTVKQFVKAAMILSQGRFDDGKVCEIHYERCPAGLVDALNSARPPAESGKPLRACFGKPMEGAILLSRTHPFVEALSAWLLDAALSGGTEAAAKRCGVTAVKEVKRRTTLLLLRHRFQIKGAQDMLAEDVQIAGYEDTLDGQRWLSNEEANGLFRAEAVENIVPDRIQMELTRKLEELPSLESALEDIADRRRQEVLESHERARAAFGSQRSISRAKIVSQGAPDVLGLYVLLPAGGGR